MLNGKGRHCQVIDHVVVDTGKIIVAGRGETDCRKYCEIPELLSRRQT